LVGAPPDIGSSRIVCLDFRCAHNAFRYRTNRFFKATYLNRYLVGLGLRGRDYLFSLGARGCEHVPALLFGILMQFVEPF
jgi:hypothetical protein